ncbi:MAG: SRPBCC family protein [Methyloligellaceae bacterium]
MSITKEIPDFMLIERRIFNVTQETLFNAWVQAEALQVWFGAGDLHVESVELDLKVGGEYKIGLRKEGGDLFYHRGEYQEITPHDRLVFTWLLEDKGCSDCSGEHGETIVTVNFIEKGRQTELVLRHEKLPSEASRSNHSMGWNACFDILASYLK